MLELINAFGGLALAFLGGGLAAVLSCIGSILFSALIGIAGGIFPAVQASRMDVVTALRFE